MEVKNLTIFGLLTILLVMAGCSTQSQGNNKVEIANPASQFCVDNGGTLKIKNEDNGQIGICVLSDGTEIEEWDFYNSKQQESELSMCKSWFDGCNTCFVTNGNIGGCTLKACSNEMMQEPKCLLYTDEKLIGKILTIDETSIDVLQGDIVHRINKNNVDTTEFTVEQTVELTYNRDSEGNSLLADIKVYKRPEDELLKCTREYMPVCAQTTIDGNGLPVLENFNNKCLAQNHFIIHEGLCGEDSQIMAEPRACTLEYAPVCAKFNGQEKTFGNSCMAKGLEIVHQGECGKEGQELYTIQNNS